MESNNPHGGLFEGGDLFHKNNLGWGLIRGGLIRGWGLNRGLTVTNNSPNLGLVLKVVSASRLERISLGNIGWRQLWLLHEIVVWMRGTLFVQYA